MLDVESIQILSNYSLSQNELFFDTVAVNRIASRMKK